MGEKRRFTQANFFSATTKEQTFRDNELIDEHCIYKVIWKASQTII